MAKLNIFVCSIQLSPVAKTPTKPKRLFHSQSPPASGKGNSSNKKEKKKSGEGSSKKARNIGLLIPKGKPLHFRPTGDMDLDRFGSLSLCLSISENKGTQTY